MHSGGKWSMFFAQCKFQTKKEKTVPFKTPGTYVRDAIQSWHILFNPVRVPWPWGPCSPSSAPARRSSFGQSSACACLPRKWKALPPPTTGPRWAAMSCATSGNPRLNPALFFSCPWVSSPTYLGSELPKAETPLPSMQSALHRGTARKNDGSGEGASASLVRKNTAYFPLEKKKQHERILIVFK